MAINFSQVKKITIPEGSVKKITDSAGNILWKEQSAEWHTIWEGSETITATKSGNDAPVISGTKENLVKTAAGTGRQPKLKITFSYSNTNTDPNWTNGLVINEGFKSESDVSSPVIMTLSNPLTTNICCVTCRQIAGDKKINVNIGLRKKISLGNNITIDLAGFSSNDITSYSGNFTLTFTITKIEQYY